jgi:hypothetical protein
MSIAVNANKRPSPFGGAEGGLRFTSQASFRSSERRRRSSPLQTIDMSPLTRRRQIGDCSKASCPGLVS